MHLPTVFRLSLYGLTAFASWMLGRAEEGWVPYVTFPVLVVAYVVTESKRHWALPAGAANALGALAVFAAAMEFFQEGQLAKLLSGAHLLVYATWIVMFQEKTIRNYWWLMGLGILQIAVSSVQANEANPAFGVYLILYVCGALWTMCVASLYQAQLQFAGVTDFNRPEQLTEHVEQRVLQYDGRERWISGRLLAGVAGLTGLSLLVSAVFFAFTPRMWLSTQKIFADETLPGSLDRRHQTGFVEAVKLGEIGEILESVKTVMEVRTYDAQGQQPVDLFKVADRLGMDEPLFRGQVLTEYENGRWLPERSERTVKRGRSFHQTGYRVDITLEPMRTDTLFTLGTPDACRIDRENETAFLNMTTGVMVRQSRPDQPERLSYSLSVKAVDPELARMHATPMPVGTYWPNVEGGHLLRCQRLPATGLDRLRRLARQVVAQAEEEAGHDLSDYEKARAIEHFLRDSGQFGYTLNLTVLDPTLDPVEDFLFLRKEGHCEYFATALTLMLRAVRIPARAVSGFKGAERNSLIGGWEVQERHAHLWVEAWVNQESSTPGGRGFNQDSLRREVWVTLDPTPAAARNASVENVASRVGFWGRMRATTTSLWTDYVVNVNLSQQRRELYGPLREFAQKLWLMGRQALNWGPIAWAHLQHLLLNPSEWLSVSGGLTAFILLSCIVLTVRLGSWLWRKLRRWEWLAGWSRRRQEMLVVAFYDRFLKVVRRHGLRRAGAETPREFATLVSERLRSSLAASGLEDLPRAVCAAYYKVRFGGELLTGEEVEHLEERLARFEGRLSR